MTSVYAGHYQGDLRDLGGNALVHALIEVRLASTATPATLYNNAVLIADAGDADSLGNSHVPAAAGQGLPGIDLGGVLSFYADAAQELDIVGTSGTDVLGPFRVRLRPDYREPPPAGSVTTTMIDAGLAAALAGKAPAGSVGSVARSGAVLSGDYASLDDWRSALKAVRAGTANARLVAMGDSTIGGWPTSFVDRVVAQWAANRLDTARHGAIYTVNPPTYAESRVIHGAGWSTGGIGDFGAANRGVAMGEVGAAGTLDIGPCEDCDRFEIFYLDGGVGSFDWWIDGGAHTTVNVGDTADVPSPSVVTTTVTPGTHTLHIGSIVGNPVFIPFAEPRLGTSGLYVSRGGLGATTSTMWTSAVSSFASSVLMFHTLQPDLTLIMLTAGDFNTQCPLDTYRANIDAMVVLGLTYGSVMLAVSPRPTITAYDEYNSYDEYIEQLESIRDARGCAMLDFAAHFSGLDSADYMADTLHPTVAAQADMSLVLAGALMP